MLWLNRWRTAGIAVWLAAALLLGLAWVQPRFWLYPLIRGAAQTKLYYDARHMETWETEHFVIQYTAADSDVVAMVAAAAETAYRQVTAAFAREPRPKTLLTIHPDKEGLQSVFGWPEETAAMGVYYGGTIQLLSPRAWMRRGQDETDFMRDGPMVHELTHLMLDHIANGNYTRWFTEGLAQYMEYRINGYEWISPGNALKLPLYTLAELEADFDGLANQALAYRQSLAMVRYLAEAGPQDGLSLIIAALAGGSGMEEAMRAAGLSYAEFDWRWREWAGVMMAGHKPPA